MVEHTTYRNSIIGRYNLMKTVKDVIRKILPVWIRKPLALMVGKFMFKVNLFSAIKATIINANEVGQIVKTIKEETVEPIIFPKAYGLFERGRIDYRMSKLDIMEYTDATVFESSDFILLQNGVVWDKFNVPQFTKIIPSDYDLLKRENMQLFIKKPKNSVNVKVGFSLCGVASKAWAHFLVQYLPKLYLIPDILKTANQTMTIILPNYTDAQVREIVYSYLNKISGVEILELKSGEAATCDILYHINNTAWLSELIEYTSPIDGIIPSFVADSLKSNLLADFHMIDKDKSNRHTITGDKLFIARNNYRNLLNYKEVENYFSEKGYLIVTPHKISLSEKIQLFNNASLIVGPHSSGFTNIIFSKKGTKVLMMCNFQKLFEPYFGFFVNYFGIDITNICGIDERSTDYNSSYTIPLSKIISACDELGF